MNASRWLVILALWTVVALAVPPQARAQASFDVFVPQKVPANGVPSPYPQIGAVMARFSVLSNAAVTFKITDVTHSASLSFPAVTPTSGTQNLSFASGDTITLWPIPDSNDPNRYEIEFKLRQNSTSGCQGLIGTSHYKVEITSGPLITAGVCLESRDGLSRPGTAVTCTNTNIDAYQIPVPLDNTSDVVATLKSPPGSNQPSSTGGCFTQRPPVDVVMVLDKSGSMSIQTTGATAVLGPTRMDALHKAVSDLLDAWGQVTPATGSGGPDRVGGVFFDTTSPTNPAIPMFPLALTNVTVATTRTNIKAAVNAVQPGGSTTIGGGLVRANSLLTPEAGRRKVVLLMSDGQQNTDPFVQSDTRLYCADSTDPLCVPPVPPTCTQGTLACSLPNQPQIYTVTLGPTAPGAINQQLANNSGGFFLNTEQNGQLLSPFFLELLQNFLRYNSYETVRIISKSAPYSAAIPLSTSSLNVAFSVTWPDIHRSLRLTVTPPGGAEPIVKDSASGFISVVLPLPLAAPFDPTKDWNINIEPTSTATGATTQGGVPFDLHIMTDDEAIKTDLSVVPQDYKAAEKIRLQAKLTRFGLPIPGVGSHPGDTIKVDLIKPGQSVGDMLSDSPASANPPAGNLDVKPGADAKLFNTLQNNPSALKHASDDNVQLFDDGKPEHGDNIAGDGIYSALYPAPLPGHYNFLFSAESVDQNSVRFSRQQLRTAYVRAVPDAVNTGIASSILRRDNGNVLSIVMTPRGKAGDRLGPGWANYFWFTTSGVTPFKAVDNLNGTYTATLPFSGTTPPNVQVHFEDVVALIDDSVTPDHLPQPLGTGNALTTVSPPNQLTGKVALFLNAGAGIPHGTFSNAFNTGFSLNAGLEYIATSHLSAEGIFGYHHFPAQVGSALDLYQFSANAKLYLTSGGATRPFVNAGIGGYKLSPGSAYFGGNLGAGVLREFTPHWGLQASYNFHTLNTPGTATKFSTLQAGIRYVF